MEFFTKLETVIRQRIKESPGSSYTADLVAGGVRRVAQKVGEEAVELSLAAVAGSRTEQLNEAADLMFHFQILLVTLGLSLDDVSRCLEERHRG